MIDPVRPVAPREDELRKLILKWRKEAAAWQHGIGENQNTRLLKECASELEALFAVEHTCDGGMNPPFPGPCAACARESGEEQLNYFCPTCHQRLIHDKAIGAIPPNLQGPAGGARDGQTEPSQSTGASTPLAAAPVPCAASPADRLKKRIGALATFPQHVYSHMGDSIGRHIVTVEVGKVFALIDELLPRATGEGAV